MKNKRAGVSLDEVFRESEKNPKWAAAYEKAGIGMRMAIQIAKAREKARLTQGQLAKAIGTTQSVISRIEKADQNLTLETLSKIAGALHSDLVIQLRWTKHLTGSHPGASAVAYDSADLKPSSKKRSKNYGCAENL